MTPLLLLDVDGVLGTLGTLGPMSHTGLTPDDLASVERLPGGSR